MYVLLGDNLDSENNRGQHSKNDEEDFKCRAIYINNISCILYTYMWRDKYEICRLNIRIYCNSYAYPKYEHQST